MKFGWFVEKMVVVYFRKERPYLENHSPPHTMHTLNSRTHTRPHSHLARMWKWTNRIVVVHLHQPTTCPHTRDDIDLKRNIKANLFSFKVPSGRARPCVSVCALPRARNNVVCTHMDRIGLILCNIQCTHSWIHMPTSLRRSYHTSEWIGYTHDNGERERSTRPVRPYPIFLYMAGYLYIYYT